MSAHPAPRATRAIRAETAGSSGLARGPNQRGKGGGEAEASIPVMAMAYQRTRGRAGRRAWRNLAAAAVSDAPRPDLGRAGTLVALADGQAGQVAGRQLPDGRAP